MDDVKINEIKLNNIHGAIYNCFVQQLMTICLYFRGEYWKLFLDNEVHINSSASIDSIEEIIDINLSNNILNAMTQYYGLNLKKIDPNTELKFTNKDDLYIVFFETELYPPAKGIEVDEETINHAFLIYDEGEDFYIVHDAFYGETSFKLDKKLFKKGLKNIKKVQQVDYNDLTSDEIKNFITLRCEKNDIDIYRTWFNICKETNSFNYDSSKFFIKLRYIGANVGMLSLIIKENAFDNLYLIECSKMLYSVFNLIRNIWYSLMKNQIKYKKIDKSIILQKINELVQLFQQEDKIKREVICLINSSPGLLDKINNCLTEYSHRTIPGDRSIYEDHDGVTILKLINYFDEEFGVEFSTISYSGLFTYEDFKLQTFKNLLQ